MESNFNNTDFEQFLRQNADQYRMFPSEKVWNGLQDRLHQRKKWYGWGLSLLILTTGVVSWVMLNTSARNRQVVSTLPAASSKQASTQIAINKHTDAGIALLKAPAAQERTSFITSPENLNKNVYKVAPITGEVLEGDELIGGLASLYNDELYKHPGAIIATAPLNPHAIAIPAVPAIARPATPVMVNATSPQRGPSKTALLVQKATVFTFTQEPSASGHGIAETQTAPAIPQSTPSMTRDSYPMTIESVTNAYIRVRQKRKMFLQAYVTPTISYRELKENKAFINSAQQANTGAQPLTYSANINSLVTHKPDIGLQMGVSGGIPLSKKLSVIGGLQFNISKYDIQAFSTPQEMTTISIRNGFGRAVNMRTVASFRNIGGSKQDWLHNLYFSASLPVGLELKTPAGRKRSYFGMSGTVQPTFILSNRAYVLSTDYKNYAEMPSLTRKWNINAGFDMFVGYNTGNLKWRVGPQVRYQVMSSFIKEYPVQEHLFDFGLKLGLLLK